MEKNQDIIRKIKGLLATAAGNANEEEAQSAFVLAQKLMMKHHIAESDVMEEQVEDLKGITGQATAFKTLYWYERYLASIISKNFRVKFYLDNRKVAPNQKVRKSITFFGVEEDVQFAKEMFVLALDALEFYAKKHVDDFYDNNYFSRERGRTADIKNSYIAGFLVGLDEKLTAQFKQLEQEFGLVVLMPAVVEKQWEEMTNDFSTSRGNRNLPRMSNTQAYKQGLKDATGIDYGRSLLDGFAL